MRRCLTIAAVAPILSILLLSSIALAQKTSGDITGSVTDATPSTTTRHLEERVWSA